MLIKSHTHMVERELLFLLHNAINHPLGSAATFQRMFNEQNVERRGAVMTSYTPLPIYVQYVYKRSLYVSDTSDKVFLGSVL